MTRNSARPQLVRKIAVVGCGMLLLAAYLIPITSTTVSVVYPTVHVIGFMALSLYFFRFWTSKGARAVIVMSLCLLSVVFQVIQDALPGREFDFHPIVYNLVGIALSFVMGPATRRMLEAALSAALHARYLKLRGRHEPGQPYPPLPTTQFSAQGPLVRSTLDLCDTFNLNLDVTVTTCFGASLRGPLLDGNVLHIARSGYIEYGVTRLLMKRLRPGAVFVDVGAHIGYFSALAAPLVGDTGKVFAFEPTPRTYAWLAGNLRGHHNTVLENLAVMDRAGVMGLTTFSDRYCSYNSFFEPRTEYPPNGRTQNVRTVALADYCRTRSIVPDIIKIDAESAEIYVIQGMKDLLDRASPLIVLELGDMQDTVAPASSSDVVATLESMGYQPYDIESGEMRPHQRKVIYPYCQVAFAR